MKSAELALYRDLLGDIKSRIRQAQHRAAATANAELLLMYRDIGRMISARQQREGWGAGVIPRLSADLKNELPELKGFSETNIKRMVRFWEAYPVLFAIGPRPVAQLEMSGGPAVSGPPAVAQLAPTVAEAVVRLPWAHNVLLLEKIKDLPTRLWYARQAAEQGWSRDALAAQIKACAHDRHGSAVTNFARTLPAPHAILAQQLLKDPYIFDFLTLEEPFHERELETGLLVHLQKFLLELGRGFAFVGRQYRLEVAGYELTRALPTELASSLPSIQDIEAELSEGLGGHGRTQ